MSDELCPPPTEDEDLTLPRASINKMIKELVRGRLPCPIHIDTHRLLHSSGAHPSVQREPGADHELLHRIHSPDKFGGKRDLQTAQQKDHQRGTHSFGIRFVVGTFVSGYLPYN